MITSSGGSRNTRECPPAPVRGSEFSGWLEVCGGHASGGNRARAVLARVLERIGNGYTLVVVRIFNGPANLPRNLRDTCRTPSRKAGAGHAPSIILTRSI